MKIIRNAHIPFGRNYGAINLFGILFVKRDMHIDPSVINHEMIHTRQMRDLLYIPFYLIYVCEWLIRLIKHRGRSFEAYMDISFEREAYAHGNDLSYLSRRKPYAQWRK